MAKNKWNKEKTIVLTSCVRMDKKASEWTLGEKQNERVIEWVRLKRVVNQSVGESKCQCFSESMSQWVSDSVSWCAHALYECVDTCISDWMRTNYCVSEWVTGFARNLGLKRSEWSNEWMSERVSLIYEWMIECVFGWGSEDYHG